MVSDIVGEIDERTLFEIECMRRSIFMHSIMVFVPKSKGGHNGKCLSLCSDNQ